jgi:hypothetical protein
MELQLALHLNFSQPKNELEQGAAGRVPFVESPFCGGVIREDEQLSIDKVTQR